ncbi:MAG: hypothetical protein AB7O62_16430 [Pirellulales bacterium]
MPCLSKHNTGMTPEQRHLLQARWQEVEKELAGLRAGKVTKETDPATQEAELLEEQDAIEFELQADQLQCGYDPSWQEDLEL